MKEYKDDEAKDDEPTKKLGKRRKQIARKGMHTSVDENVSDDSDKVDEQEETNTGTETPLNPVPDSHEKHLWNNCGLHVDMSNEVIKEDWDVERVSETSDDICSKTFDNLRFISLELPQQPNSFDYGLFLLHYVELFLEQAPVNFNPFKISKSVDFLNVDWFPFADATLKRVVIQRLVYDLLEAPSHKSPPENGGQSVHSLTEIDLEQDNEITPRIPYSSQDLNNSNLFETSPQTSISGCEDSLAVINNNKQMNEEVNFMEIRQEPRLPLKEHVEIPDDNDNGNGYAYNLTLSSHFSEMQANGSTTGSGESSGLESDVQHLTKKMRTTEPPLEDGSPFS
ncbi:probable ubiquitin-like-specific protease 2B isoform X2 [Tanacetum coccineum]